jgi:hypothetical protein
MQPMDWFSALDFERALTNVQSDIRGDWYRDPWDWKELEWMVPDSLSDHAIPRLNSSGVKHTARLDVAKENFSVRPAVVLDPLDRFVYQALVDCLSERLIGDLTARAYGWRLRRNQPRAGLYEPNDEEWESFRDHLKRLAEYDFATLTTDVVSFFSSIPSEPLLEQILVLGGNEPARRLADMVESWYRTAGRGLPQRSAASAALAHMYLRPLDDVINQFAAMPPRGLALVPEGRALRWMDDIWVFARRMSSLREAQIAIQGGMRSLGLEMNFGKTRVLYGDAMTDAVYNIEHSAVDDGLKQDDQDVEPLDALIDKILAEPEIAERTSIRFMCTRMREHSLFERVDEIAAVVDRMPHGADHLARLFRDSGKWHDMQDWYVTFARRWRTRLPWTVGQLGTMFPSGASVEAPVRELCEEIVASGNSPLPLLSLAAQRLAVWGPESARVLVREVSSDESHPLARRTLALAALHAGEVRSVLRQILQQHEENGLVLAMLEGTNFRPAAVPVSADFAG